MVILKAHVGGNACYLDSLFNGSLILDVQDNLCAYTHASTCAAHTHSFASACLHVSREMYVACVHVNLHRATYLCVCICIHVFNRLYLSLCPCFTPTASRIHTSYHIFTHHIKTQCVKYRSCNTRIMHAHTRTHKHHLCKHISKHIHVHKLYTRVT